MTEWIKVCETKPLKNGDLLDFDHGDKNILISKAGNKIYATDRICTHAYADLSTGFLNDTERTITCPLHMSSFRLNDGVPLNLPAEEPIKTYQTKIEDGVIYVLMD